jgi:hypothetical protein
VQRLYALQEVAIHKGSALRYGSDRREQIEKYWRVGIAEKLADYSLYIIEN